MATAKPIKFGDKIAWTRRNGESARGKIVNIYNRGKGDWLDVDVIGENGKVTTKRASIRPSQATRV